MVALQSQHFTASNLATSLRDELATVKHAYDLRLAEKDTLLEATQAELLAQQSLQRQIEQYETKVVELDFLHQSTMAQLADAEQTVASQATSLSNLQGRYDIVMQDLERLNEAHAGKLLEYEHLKGQQSSLEARVLQLTSTLEEREALYRSDVAGLHQNLEEAKERITHLEAADRNLRTQLEGSEAHANSLVSTIETRDASIAEYQSMLSAMEDDLDSSKSSEESTKASLVTTSAELATLIEETRLREADMAKLEEELRRKESLAVSLQTSLDISRSAAVQLESEVMELAQELQGALNQRDSLAAELETAVAGFDQLQVDFDNTLQRAQAAEEELEARKASQKVQVEGFKRKLRLSLANQEQELDSIVSWFITPTCYVVLMHNAL